MKYVILIEEVTEGIQRAHHLIFPEYMTHAVVAESYQMGFWREENRAITIFSAGFCYPSTSFEGLSWDVEVGSESLKVKKDQKNAMRDKNLLERPEAFQGLVY